MTIAFAFANMLANLGTNREKRFFHTRELWRNLHRAGHRMLIVDHVDKGSGWTPIDEVLQPRRDAIDYTFVFYQLPQPYGIHIVTTNIVPTLQSESVDLYIGDTRSWCDLVSKAGITSLRLA